MPRLHPTLLAFVLALTFGSAEAQIRPEPSLVKTAESMRAKRASAEEVASELARTRSTPAQITAVLHAVGFEHGSITAALTRTLRMDAARSAKAWQEAMGDADLAMQALMLVARSNAEVIRIARSDLRMDARGAVSALRGTQERMTAKAQAERMYADLTTGGYGVREALGALRDELGSTPSELFDAMLAQGASLSEIAVGLTSDLGQTAEQVRELFQAKSVNPSMGAEALSGIGSPMEALFLIFLQAQLEGQQDAATWLAIAESAQPFVESSALAVEWLSAHMSGLALASAGFALVVVEQGSIPAAMAAGELEAMTVHLAAFGVTLADAFRVFELLDVTDQAMVRIAHFMLGNTSDLWAFLGQTMGWSAERAEEALAEFLPPTIEFLSEFLALGGTTERMIKIIESLRAAGLSAVDIAMEVGADLGVLPMAQALWGAGYGVAEVTGGLVQGMQVSTAEAAQVVAGLAGGMDRDATASLT